MDSGRSLRASTREREKKKKKTTWLRRVSTHRSLQLYGDPPSADEMRRWMVCLLPEIIHEMCRVVAVAAAVESI